MSTRNADRRSRKTRRRHGRQGFASMDPEEQREIASMGGRASHGGRGRDYFEFEEEDDDEVYYDEGPYRSRSREYEEEEEYEDERHSTRRRIPYRGYSLDQRSRDEEEDYDFEDDHYRDDHYRDDHYRYNDDDNDRPIRRELAEMTRRRPQGRGRRIRYTGHGSRR